MNYPGWSSSQDSIQAPVLIIGLGNPILGDDGVGWRVAEQVANRCQTRLNDSTAPLIEVDCLAVGGLALMERMIGYDRVILIDAISTGIAPAGTISAFPLNDLPDRAVGHLCSAHDTTLKNALKVGQEMGAHIPAEITVVGIEASAVYDFSDVLTPDVEQSIPEAINLVMELIK